MNSNFDKTIDPAFFTVEEWVKLQNRKLAEHLSYCAGNSPYYAGLLASIPSLSEITVDQISRLPLTTKEDLTVNNESFYAVPSKKIVDIVMSSGTTGAPTTIKYTEGDLKRLAYNEYTAFRTCGLTEADIALLTCTIDRCFVAGLAYFLGLKELGAATIRNGHGSMRSHTYIVTEQKPTVLIGVPSFLRKLGLYMKSKDYSPADSSVTKIVCIGEPLRDRNLKPTKICRELESIWNAEAFSTYASSEIVTTFCECEHQVGGHMQPELGIVEILNDDDEPLASGEIGEIVVTPFETEGMPLIRFRTGDLGYLIDEPCLCGRTSPRLSPILGRKKQMLKIKGTTVYPMAIFAALSEIKEIAEYYLEVTSSDDLVDDVKIFVSINSEISVQQIQDELQARVRVKPRVVIEDNEIIKKIVYTPESRKPVRFIDRRESECGKENRA